MPASTAAPPSAPPAAPDKATIDAPAAGERAPADFMADVMGDFDSMESGTPPPAKPADKPAATPKPAAATKPPERETKPPESATKPPEGETKPPSAEVKPVKAAELRTAYEGLKKKVQTELEPELQRLRSQVKDMEGKTKGEDAEPLKQQVKSLQERNDALERRIQYVDFTKSKKFHDEHVAPYAQAWSEAVSEFKELTVREQGPENEMGERPVVTRPATEHDLIKLGAMNLSEMDEAAQTMFGASAHRAVTHIQNLRKLATARQKALEEAETKSVEWAKSQTEERETLGKKLAGLWETVTKELETKLPRAFQVDATDELDKQAHTKGFALADLLFLGPKALNQDQVEALPEVFKSAVKSGQPLTEELSVKLHALARLKMANHDRQLSKLRKAQERIADLEKELSEYKDSTPPADRAGRTSEQPGSKDWLQTAEDELRAIDR